MFKKRITSCLKCVFAGLLKYIGISGLIGAGIGLLYTPLSIVAIGMAYNFEGNTLVGIITLPAVLFFFFAAWIDEIGIGVIDFPGVLVPIVFFTAVGTVIGASVHWIKNLIGRTRSGHERSNHR